MSEVSKTNTYDENIAWHFHESFYYVKPGTYYLYRCDNVQSGGSTGTRSDCYLYIFGLNDFGPHTIEYINEFAGYYGYKVYSYDDCIVVSEYDYFDKPNGTRLRNVEGIYEGAYYIEDTENTFHNLATKYVTNNGFPSDNYYWSDGVYIPVVDSGEEEISGEDIGDNEETGEDVNTGEGNENDNTGENPGDNESHNDDISEFEDIDIDDIEGSESILREIYKSQVVYQKDMLEVQQNAFDISVVNLSLSFCSVFLCGILVGCAFAKSLWHKMNVG